MWGKKPGKGSSRVQNSRESSRQWPNTETKKATTPIKKNERSTAAAQEGKSRGKVFQFTE